jgi:hypothetical protein
LPPPEDEPLLDDELLELEDDDELELLDEELEEEDELLLDELEDEELELLELLLDELEDEELDDELPPESVVTLTPAVRAEVLPAASEDETV